MGVKVSVAFIAVAVVVSGCAVARQREAFQQVAHIREGCTQKRLARELPSYVAWAHCANERSRPVIAESGFPYMDLMDLYFAYRVAVSKRVDDGQLSEEEMHVQLADLLTRVNSEILHRNAMSQEARLQAIQSYGTLLQGLGAWNQSLQPATSRPITCSGVGNTVTCY